MAFEAKAKSENTPKWVKYINPVNWVKGIVRFFISCALFVRDSFKEGKRVTWPELSKVEKSTLVVIICVIILTGFIWLADSIFNKALGSLLKLLS